MTEVMTQSEMFAEITKSQQWHAVEDLVEKLDEAGFWTEQDMAAAEQAYKKDYVRRMARGMKGSDGWPMLASVVETRPDGTKRRIYKQEVLFTLDDYRQVVTYHKDRGIHHITMANGYARRCGERLGEQMPLPFSDAA